MPDSSPHFMKATACSDAKKETSLESSCDSEPCLDGVDQTQSQANSQPNMCGSLVRTCSSRGVTLGVKSRKCSLRVKSTCASTIKNSKFPEMCDWERLSRYEVCSYRHCSLNKHSHGPEPGKNFGSRKRLSKKPDDKRRSSTVHADGKSARVQDSEPISSNTWEIMQRHLVSALSDDTNQLAAAPEISDSCKAQVANAVWGDENQQEMEVKKLIAVKIVREAIEKILLPEVSDQSSDSQSMTSDQTTLDQETLENNKDSKDSESCLITDDSTGPREKVKTIREVAMKAEKKAPKHWSNLKKWILLQRFVKELEKVRKIDPTEVEEEPRTEAEAEAEERVHRRALNVDEKKRTEEWMVDYALRQAITQLAPTQKRKVELLVRAFETVVSPDQHKLNSEEHMAITTTRDTPCRIPQEVGTGSGEFTQTLPLLERRETVSKHMAIKENEIPPAANDTIYQDKKVATEEEPKHISMWHMISQHVLSGVISKVGTGLLEGTDEEEEEYVHTVGETETRRDLQEGHHRRDFSRDDAIEVVKEVVNEILITDVQDDSPQTQSRDDSIVKEHGKKQVSLPAKSKNWSKVKKLVFLKRSIAALQNAEKPEKVNLRHQMMDERRKAEQWMLDYALQNIVTKLTPSRKRRVSMLVEAFEAVVPFPQA